MNQNICYNCGGEWISRGGRLVCAHCGSYKPAEITGEELTLLYTAFQKLRLAEFYEAEQEFDDIIQRYPRNAQAYWGRLMARYGIKYEEDYDGARIPTCYATSIESIFAASDYKKAMECADTETRAVFKEHASYIERVRKEWVEKAKKEKPYDIFICYKDSDLARGVKRTRDSFTMQDLYIYLTNKGYRVFFSHETLREKTGEKYEPYIFNALSTAKIMLVYGSDPDYINATWVKNEWTRYKKRMQAGEKKLNSLLVAYEGFSPNELPLALSSTQCFDATDRRFYSDLTDKIEEILFEKNSVKTILHKPTAPKQPALKNKVPAPRKKMPKQNTAKTNFSATQLAKLLKNKLFYCILSLIAIVVSRFLPNETVWPQIIMGLGFSVLLMLLTFMIKRKEDELWLLLYTILFTVLPAVSVILILCGIKAYILFLILLFVSVACLSATFFYMFTDDTCTEGSTTMCIISLSLCMLEAIILSALTMPSLAAQIFIGVLIAVWAIWTVATVMKKGFEGYTDEACIAVFVTMLSLTIAVGLLWIFGVTLLAFILSVLFAGIYTVLLYFSMVEYVEYAYGLAPVGLSVYMIFATILAAVLFPPLVTHLIVGGLFTAYLAFATVFAIKNKNEDSYLAYFIVNIIALGLFILAAFFFHVALIVYAAALVIVCNILTQRTLTHKNSDIEICKILSVIAIAGCFLLGALTIALG